MSTLPPTAGHRSAEPATPVQVENHLHVNDAHTLLNHGREDAVSCSSMARSHLNAPGEPGRADDSCLDRIRENAMLKFSLAVVIVLSLIFNSISQSEYAQYKYSDLKWKSYYFLAWFTMVWLSVLFPAWLVCESVWFGGTSVARYLLAGAYSDKMHPSRRLPYLMWVKRRISMNPSFSVYRYLWAGLLLTGLNLLSAYTWYLSLEMIAVAINSALYRFSFVLVFVLSVIFLRETVTYWKVLALLFSGAGVISVGAGNYLLGDSGNFESSRGRRLEGYILVVVSAFLYACYEVFYRRLIGEANIHGIMLINSLMGFWSLVAFMPFVPIMFYAGAEPVIQATSQNLSFLFINAAFAVSYYLLYTIGMSITSPLYISLSSLIGIPLSALADFVLHGESFSWLTIMGMCLVCWGVVLANFDQIIFELRHAAKSKSEDIPHRVSVELDTTDVVDELGESPDPHQGLL